MNSDNPDETELPVPQVPLPVINTDVPVVKKATPYVSTYAKSSNRFKKYNLLWPSQKDPSALELDMIRLGGQWIKKDGEPAGNGLFYHYRRFQEIVWPEKIWEKGPFKNHWAEKCLEVYLNYVYIGAMGCAGSGKSDSFGGNVLTDWYAHSDCTTVLVSSTSLDSLELRIWGMIKKYHKAAKSGRVWLPGYMIEGRKMITLDPRDDSGDGRDFKNGVIAVACKKGNQYVGLGPLVGIHNKRVRLLADECFVAGTMVDLPWGQQPIEKVKVGDVVVSALGSGRVIRTIKNIATSLVRVNIIDGRSVTCTPDHLFLTQTGWKKAIDLNQSHYIPCDHETMRILQIPHAGKKPPFLQSVLQCEVDAQPAGNPQGAGSENIEGVHPSASRPSRVGERSLRAYVEQFSNEKGISSSEVVGYASANRPQAPSSRGQRNRTHGSGTDNSVQFPGIEVESLHTDRSEAWKRIPAGIQSRYSVPVAISGGGGGRRIARPTFKTGTGREKNKYAYGAWVDCVEVLKQEDIDRLSKCVGGVEVYNLEVEGHPSYSVNGGLIVHNCNLMPRAFLDAASNLSKCENFKLVGLGNPNETTNAHGFLCEPSVEMGGWEGGVDQTPGTKIWPTRFPNGICIQLPGSDSPNMQVELGDEPPFGFLITRQQMMDDAQIWGVDDWHYTMMNEAKMPRGQGSRRVLTRQMCVKFGAFTEPNWRDTKRTKIAFLDAAYRGVGGDRCVFGELQFGVETEQLSEESIVSNLLSQSSDPKRGRHIIALIDLTTIPISSGVGAESSEDQIVGFVMAQCRSRGIPSENFYYDAGMRTSLVTAFSRLWEIGNSVDCGGKPSESKVSSEIQVSCRDYYSKFVTELWFSVRYAVEAGQFRGMTEEAATEFSQREWKMVSGNRIEIEAKEEMKVKCFVAGTMISTPAGDRVIESIKSGELVDTPFGPSPVVAIHANETEGSLTRITLSDGVALVGTSDHKVFTWDKGWMAMDTLSLHSKVESRHSLWIWKIANALFTKTTSTTFKHLVDIISGAGAHGIRSRREFYTGLFGLTTLVQSLKTSLFTTLMEIGGTTAYPIWSWLIPKNTPATTFGNDGRSHHSENVSWMEYQTSSPSHSSGTDQKKVGLGTGPISLPCGASVNRKPSHAASAQAHSRRSMHTPSSAPPNALTRFTPNRIMTWLRFALSAASRLWEIATPSHRIALKAVLRLPCGNPVKVYNLTLLEHNAYYANGILVANCGRSPDLADAVAIGMYGARQKGFLITKMSSVTPKPPKTGPDWRDELKKKARAFSRSGLLNYKS